jgi:hypothetical protein
LTESGQPPSPEQRLRHSALLLSEPAVRPGDDRSSEQTRLRCRFSLAVRRSRRLVPFLKSSLELCDQARQGFGLLIRGEVTAGQPLDL